MFIISPFLLRTKKGRASAACYCDGHLKNDSGVRVKAVILRGSRGSAQGSHTVVVEAD